MPLQEIEYGSLASSPVLNANFNELQNQITALAQKISANTANIANNTSDIAALAAKIDVNKSEV